MTEQIWLATLLSGISIGATSMVIFWMAARAIFDRAAEGKGESQ